MKLRELNDWHLFSLPRLLTKSLALFLPLSRIFPVHVDVSALLCFACVLKMNILIYFTPIIIYISYHNHMLQVEAN